MFNVYKRALFLMENYGWWLLLSAIFDSIKSYLFYSSCTRFTFSGLALNFVEWSRNVGNSHLANNFVFAITLITKLGPTFFKDLVSIAWMQRRLSFHITTADITVRNVCESDWERIIWRNNWKRWGDWTCVFIQNNWNTSQCPFWSNYNCMAHENFQ